jgi:hypothetical protein
MSISKCGKCEGTSFKLVTQEPSGSKFKLNFIQCSSCSTPFGVTDFFNTGAQMEAQNNELAAMKRQLATMENTLQRLLEAFNRR